MPPAEKDTVSVIIPTYNRASVLGRAIDSVLNQELPAMEIIIIDDGSSDDSRSLIAEKYSHCHYFRQENQGISCARNSGIKLAKGQWIAFLDSDDEWLPAKLANQIGALRKNQQYRICHCNEIWVRNGRRVNPGRKHEKSGGQIFAKCLPLCVISPSSVLIHRTIFSHYGIFDQSLPVCEDYDMWLRICAYQPVLYLSQPQIIKYGGHSDQLSRRYNGMDRFRIRALEKIIADPNLSAEKREAAVKVLLQKTAIYINGARKRGKTAEVEQFSKIIKKYKN
jgi:glycosyltransferase involved in cell wall biosynthesis